MKRILILVVALGLFWCSTASAFQGGGGESIKKGSGKKGLAQQRKASRTPTLTLAVAQRILLRHLNDPSVDNVLWTCRACYSEDKEENDDFAVVTEYSNLSQYLARRGYVRRASDGNEVFTAKAKRSKHFEAWGTDEGTFGGAGFRFANFRNPKISVSRIIDPKHVPFEYDIVPTDVTMQFFGNARRVESFVAFSYEHRKWTICIACPR